MKGIRIRKKGESKTAMQRTIRKPNLLMRACPRCGGDLYRDMLESGVEFVCLQCGRRADKSLIQARSEPAQTPPWRNVA